jgi:hypothetical protein
MPGLVLDGGFGFRQQGNAARSQEVNEVVRLRPGWRCRRCRWGWRVRVDPQSRVPRGGAVGGRVWVGVVGALGRLYRREPDARPASWGQVILYGSW